MNEKMNENYYYVSVRYIDYKGIASRFKASTTDFNATSVYRGTLDAHTSITQALNKCNKNGFIYVFDGEGHFVECIQLQSVDAVSEINKYAEPKKRLDANDIRRINFELKLGGYVDEHNPKNYFRTRYNAKTRVTGFELIWSKGTGTPMLIINNK